ncbi:MAG: class I SAM-dependent methyltransferase [Acidobacteria bacterium]|nr:class I SAM-dependent methyltransferase [Acidobacteriota bacterium]
MAYKDRVYYNLKTHLEMLQDRTRCWAYQKALKTLVHDKIVLDVGCGSGILSFFAARAGAQKVLAVDLDIPPGAEEVAQANGLADCIQFIPGDIRNITLPVESVDIIVSEWMGGLLLMEDMLPAVLYARDRWLKPGGILLPDQGRLFLVPLGDVAGIDSKHFPTLRENISSQMWVSHIDSSRFLAEPCCILDLDLNVMKESEAKCYRSEFHFSINESGKFNGFGLWFDVTFSKPLPPVFLTTAPWLPPTHWGQGLWILPHDIDVKPGTEISGTFSQTKISASTASFQTAISIKSKNGGEISLSQDIDANPSNMNPPGANEGHIARQAADGEYRGLECLWIGCSMSFGVLSAARNGAKNVTVLNHSPWAGKTMHQLAEQEGLPNICFISEIPAVDFWQDKNIRILGTADASWGALLSHIRARTILGQATFPVRFYRQESDWKEFYGFDFSAYAPYDLEMYHEDNHFSNGIMLEDITALVLSSNSKPVQAEDEIIYAGKWTGDSSNSLNLLDGVYNRLKVGFHCGAVVLPLPAIEIEVQKGKQLQKIELVISVRDAKVCRFTITLSYRGWVLQHSYEQPLISMGHIIRNY